MREKESIWESLKKTHTHTNKNPKRYLLGYDPIMNSQIFKNSVHQKKKNSGG